MDVFLFVARLSSQGHLTSALKHDLTKDCVTDFYLCQSQTCPFFRTSHRKNLCRFWLKQGRAHIVFLAVELSRIICEL